METALQSMVLKSRFRMKNYNLIPQEKDNYCVCSVLQAIFDFYGKRLNQKDISERLTSSEKRFKL